MLSPIWRNVLWTRHSACQHDDHSPEDCDKCFDCINKYACDARTLLLYIDEMERQALSAIKILQGK